MSGKNSNKKNNIAGTVRRIAVVDKTIFECKVYFLKLVLRVTMSVHIRKPIPPMTTRLIIVIITTGSSAKVVRDEKGLYLPIISNPALQKAETELKTEIHIPLAPKSGIKTNI